MHYRPGGHKRVVKRAMNVLYFASRPPYKVDVGLPSVTNAHNTSIICPPVFAYAYFHHIMVKISVRKYRRTFHYCFTNPNRTKSRAKGRPTRCKSMARSKSRYAAGEYKKRNINIYFELK